MRLITVQEYLMGRATLDDLTFDQASNMHGIVSVANQVLMDFGEFRKVNSGYRRPEDNAAIGGAKKSAHMTCEAVDLEDKDGRLKAFLTEEKLKHYGLYMESPDFCPSWAHIQTRATKSGARVFKP